VTTKTVSSLVVVLSLVVFLSGCTSLQVGTEFGSGREAYLAGNNDAALSYFQSAAQKNSDYTYYGYTYRQGIWSYVGRTEYATGKLPQARQSLERALSLNNNEDVARLYLGLTLVRSGDRQQGLKEIEGGMKGIYDQSEYITQAFRFTQGRFWDPRGEIRSAIQGNLAMLSGKDLDVQRLIADGEWLGKRVEQEIDWARRDQRDDFFRDGAARQD
jgi:tetratricopeptide (TPR) repeat protein